MSEVEIEVEVEVEEAITLVVIAAYVPSRLPSHLAPHHPVEDVEDLGLLLPEAEVRPHHDDKDQSSEGGLTHHLGHFQETGYHEGKAEVADSGDLPLMIMNTDEETDVLI